MLPLDANRPTVKTSIKNPRLGASVLMLGTKPGSVYRENDKTDDGYLKMRKFGLTNYGCRDLMNKTDRAALGRVDMQLEIWEMWLCRANLHTMVLEI